MLGLDDRWKIHANFYEQKEAVKDFKWLVRHASVQREFILVSQSPQILLNDEIPF